jgi:hypothetical protein
MGLIGRLLWLALLAAAISGEPLLAHQRQTLKTPT